MPRLLFWRLRVRLAITGMAGVLCIAACGDGDSGGGAAGGSGFGGERSSSGGKAGATSSASAGAAPVSEATEFLNDYAAAVCAMYEPCCNAEWLGFDQAGCTEWFSKVTAAYFGPEYRSEEGSACLAALDEARVTDPDRCSTVPVFAEATLRDECSLALGQRARTGEPLGGKCVLAGDCASAEGGSVICYGGTCMLQRRGAAGDGPCYLSGSAVDGLPKEAFTCNAKDDLYCHRGDNVCTPRVGAGDYCPYPTACTEGTSCVGGTCQGLPGPGRAVGEACQSGEQCASKVCVSDACAKSDFTKNLNCTG